MARTKMLPKDYDAVEKLELVTGILIEAGKGGFEGLTAKDLALKMLGVTEEELENAAKEEEN